MQRVLDPFFGSGKDEHGTIVCNIEARDLGHYNLDNEDKLRAEFNYNKEHGEAWELEEDEDQARIQILNELGNNTQGIDVEEWKDIIAKELGVFGQGERYSFNKDLKSAYHRSLRSSTESKIFESIPDHYFWDIKTPQQANPVIRKNRYNPFRGREYENFFEMRASEQYMDQNSKKENLNPSVSMYRRY